MALKQFTIEITIIANEYKGQDLRERIGGAAAEVINGDETMTDVSLTGEMLLSCQEAREVQKYMR